MQARRRSRLRSLYLWHRWLGITAALPLFFIALTGLLLNHGDALGLDRQPVRAAWILSWYGMGEPGELRAWPLGEGRWILWQGRRLYLDDRPLGERPEAPIGVVAGEGWLAVADAEGVSLYTPEGELVERLARGILPGRPRALGLDPRGRLVLETETGRYRADEALLHWSPLPSQGAEEVRWSRAGTPPAALAETVRRQWRGEDITWERLLLDTHSGRLLGSAGVLLADAAALLLMALAPTGVLLWLRARRRAREHRQKKG